MFITRAKCGMVIEQLLSTFSVIFQAPSSGWNGFMTMGSGGFESSRWTKQGVGGKCCLLIRQMRQADWAAAEHLLSPFSSPFFGVKLLHDYGFRRLYHHPSPSDRSHGRSCCRSSSVAATVGAPHCKDNIPKFRNKYSQKRNIGVSVPIFAFMCLWAIYIFPGSVCLLCWRKYVDPSWDYINRSQTHECGNWG